MLCLELFGLLFLPRTALDLADHPFELGVESDAGMPVTISDSVLPAEDQHAELVVPATAGFMLRGSPALLNCG